eukprot:IDg23090t1
MCEGQNESPIRSLVVAINMISRCHAIRETASDSTTQEEDLFCRPISPRTLFPPVGPHSLVESVGKFQHVSLGYEVLRVPLAVVPGRTILRDVFCKENSKAKEFMPLLARRGLPDVIQWTAPITHRVISYVRTPPDVLSAARLTNSFVPDENWREYKRVG